MLICLSTDYLKTHPVIKLNLNLNLNQYRTYLYYKYLNLQYSTDILLSVLGIKKLIYTLKLFI